MRLARVIGMVVSTVKDERQVGYKLLVVQPVDLDGRPQDGSVVAIDAAQAGVGDYVLLLAEGKSARQVLDSKDVPCEAIVVGVIDSIQADGRARRLGPPGPEGSST